MIIKVLLWLYSITATLYWCGYQQGNELIHAHAVGVLWVLMMGGPILLSTLLIRKFAVRA